MLSACLLLFCPLLLLLVVISFLMDCCSKGLEMSNKSNLLFPLQDNTSYTFGVEKRILQGEQSHERIPGKVKGKCQGCKEPTQSNTDRQQSSEPAEGEGREKVPASCAMPGLGHQGGHSRSTGDTV